jgi:hypothetical protein
MTAQHLIDLATPLRELSNILTLIGQVEAGAMDAAPRSAINKMTLRQNIWASALLQVMLPGGHHPSRSKRQRLPAAASRSALAPVVAGSNRAPGHPQCSNVVGRWSLVTDRTDEAGARGGGRAQRRTAVTFVLRRELVEPLARLGLAEPLLRTGSARPADLGGTPPPTVAMSYAP